MPSSDLAPDPAGDLQAYLRVEQLDTDLFRAAPLPEGPARVFGGQVVGQALVAAGQDLADAAASTGAQAPQAHSLHAYFLRPGDSLRPILFQVMRDLDGRSFANRRVVALQNGQPILNLAASFHHREDGLTHQPTAPDVPAPEKCPLLADVLVASGSLMPAALFARLDAFEMRPCPPVPSNGGIATQRVWLRLARPLQPDPAMARALMAYVSDFALLTTATLPHDVPLFSPAMQFASLDHAVWFHETPPVDDWLLYVMESPQAGHARGYARGSLYTAGGLLVASVTQEGLIRRK